MMSAGLKPGSAAARPDTAADFQVRPLRHAGPSRRRRRANNRLRNMVALFAMSAWAAVVLMPVVAALYAIYGY